ncbi:MAG TPA: DUF4258 domain-containing protein [Hanamia sp.]|nr:DUF4258 domain-containing protein [Hanamia sp.]
MKQKPLFYFVIFIVIVFVLLKTFTHLDTRNKKLESFRDISHLILTKHVKCRMGCRHITEQEIKEIVENGKVNYRKSGIASKGDSTFALEGYTNENQHIRVVVAPESDGLVIITCIDLEHEWPCNCY